MGQLRTVVAGGLVAAALDITDACLFFGIRNNVPPMRIGQSIASGLLGDAAYGGGWGSAALGLGLHALIAIGMAVALYAVAKLLPLIGRHVLLFAPVYGVILWAVMTYLVLPLSGFKGGHDPHFPPQMTASFANAMFAHVVLVATPIALFVKRALKAA